MCVARIADTLLLPVRLTDWGITALSAQIGYTVPFKSMLQLKK